MRNNLTELHDTTGANVSGSPSSRSPRTQYRALYLLISPSGVRLHLKTQVPGGRIRDLVLDVSVSVHVLFFSKLAISAAAAAIHFERFAVSDIASSYDSVSGSDGEALKARGGGGRPHSMKSQALGSTK